MIDFYKLRKSDYILEFKDIHGEDLAQAGEKGVEVANIIHAGCRVPDGFVITSGAFEDFFEYNKLWEKINRLLGVFDLKEGQNSLIVSERIMDLIKGGGFEERLKKEIIDRYEELGGMRAVKVNISSSYDGYNVDLEHIKGEANLLSSIRGLWASFFYSERLIFYSDAASDISSIRPGIVVRAELEARIRGIGFTKAKNKHEGENFVLVEVADEKSALEFSKSHKDEVVRTLKLIDRHYFFGQQVDWIWFKGAIFVLEIRPASHSVFSEIPVDKPRGVQPILVGRGSGFGVATGVVRVITSSKQLIRVKRGEVVVAKEATRDFFSVFGRVSALVVEKGEGADYISIISRELKLPMVIAQTATKKLSDGMVVTVFGGSGEVYWGDGSGVNFKGEVIEAKNEAGGTATKIYVCLSSKIGLKRDLTIDGVCPFIGGKAGGLGARNKAWLFRLCERVYPKSVVYQFSSVEPGSLKNEIDIAREVRAEFPNLWVGLPSVDRDEFLEAKRILAASGLLRRGDFKIFLSVGTPSAFFGLKDLLDLGVDGVVVDLRGLYRLFSGKVRDDEIGGYQNDNAFSQLVEGIVKKSLESNLGVIVYERNIYLYHEFVHKLVESGVSGISTRPAGVERLRSVVYEAENKLISSLGIR